MNFEERIAKLERENRRWRWAVTGLMLMLLLVVSAGAVGEKLSPETIYEKLRVRSIELVNQNEKVVGSISTSKYSCYMQLKNVDGSRSAYFSDGFISVEDQSHNSRITPSIFTMSRTPPEKQRERAEIKKARQEGKHVGSEKLESAYTGDVDMIWIGTDDYGMNSFFSLYNSSGKEIVKIGPTTTNAGKITVNRVDGSPGNVLAPR